jgi:hypothetical protein
LDLAPQADWSVMKEAEASGSFAPMFDLLVGPFRATIVEPLD